MADSSDYRAIRYYANELTQVAVIENPNGLELPYKRMKRDTLPMRFRSSDVETSGIPYLCHLV